MIFMAGIAWRLSGTFLLRRNRDLSTVRHGASGAGGALYTVATRNFPRREFVASTAFTHIAGYTMHIGIAIVVFGFIPHILFFKDLIGLGWAGLSTNLVEIAAVFAIAAMAAQMLRRLFHPVLRAISTPDDYLSWLITLLPLITGVAAHDHWVTDYEMMLALHLLSVELLMVWTPFSKLLHGAWILPSRAQLGSAFGRRGVRI